MSPNYLVLIIFAFFQLVSCKNVIEKPKVEVTQVALASFNHKEIKESCRNCHSITGKSNKLTHVEQYDCKICHTYPQWKAGHYGHKPMPKTCIECHIKALPKPKDGFPHWAKLDCNGCHNVTDWKKISYQHSINEKKCIICHAKDNPYYFHGMRAECIYCHQLNDGGW